VVRGGYGLYYGPNVLNIPLFMIQQINPTIFVSVFSIAAVTLCPEPIFHFRIGVLELIRYQTIPPPPTQLPNNSTGRIMDPDYQNPLTQQWNAGYAWALNSYSVLEFEYTHILGLHESKTVNINPTRAMFLDSAGAEITSRPLTAALTAAHQPILGRIDLEQSSGRSRYDGMNISYRRRLHKGFTVNATYTLSKAQAYNGNSAAFENRGWDPFNYFAPYEYGPTPKRLTSPILDGKCRQPTLGFSGRADRAMESARP
jgi:hypothetical protein